MKKAKQLRQSRKNSTENGKQLLSSETGSFILEMFKYIANMLMLMNGTAALTLLNRSPKDYYDSILAFAFGCSVPALFYMLAYAFFCDIILKNIKMRKGYTIANIAIITAFVLSLAAFYIGIYNSNRVPFIEEKTNKALSNLHRGHKYMSYMYTTVHNA